MRYINKSNVIYFITLLLISFLSVSRVHARIEKRIGIAPWYVSEDNVNSSPKKTITRKPTATETYTPTLRPTSTRRVVTPTITNTPLSTWTTSPSKTPSPTITRKPTIIITKIVTATLTRNPTATDTATQEDQQLHHCLPKHQQLLFLW